MDRKKAIKDYWEDPKTVSMMDENLYEMETCSIAKHIHANDIVLNIGCGDGVAMRRYAERAYLIHGVDYSVQLCKKAMGNLREYGNVSIHCFDFMEKGYSYEKPTVVVSQRFLINLESPEMQQKAIHNVFNLLPSGGLFIMAENFSQSFDKLNTMRRLMGIPEIKRHWHNLYLDETKTMKLFESYGTVESIESFDYYILLTRVYGQMISPLFKKDKKQNILDEAARKLSEHLDRKEVFTLASVMDIPFGPNQTWVVRKK
jgi:SAM-dependent methyltransferase